MRRKRRFKPHHCKEHGLVPGAPYRFTWKRKDGTTGSNWGTVCTVCRNLAAQFVYWKKGGRARQLARMARIRKENPEHLRRINRRWRKRNKKELAFRRKIDRSINGEKERARVRKWYSENIERERKRARENAKARKQKRQQQTGKAA